MTSVQAAYRKLIIAAKGLIKAPPPVTVLVGFNPRVHKAVVCYLAQTQFSITAFAALQTFIHSTSLLSKRDYGALRKERSTASGELATCSMYVRYYKMGGSMGKKMVTKTKLMEGSSVR